MSFDKIQKASFIATDTVMFSSPEKLREYNLASLYCGESVIQESVKIELKDEKIDGSGVYSHIATAKFDKLSKIEFDGNYILKVDDTHAYAVKMNLLTDSLAFIKRFEGEDAQNTEYGAIYDPNSGSTAFTLWAPFASEVSVNLYERGTGDCLIRTYKMNKRQGGLRFGGVWELKVDEDILNKYYTYSVTNYGTAVETCDPYALSVGENGERAMVMDFDAASPCGWEQDKHLYVTHPEAADTPIIWEAHVRDFSVSPDSGMKHKGKYLAFTEVGTTVPGTTAPTGIDYLKKLGITYLHFNPVYDFVTVDEGALTIADGTKDLFNWGYDPQNYNVPEGSYSTDPADGRARVREFKAMVMALHNAGIGVIMDVVYNHTYSVDGQPLNDTAPGYYHRTNADGMYTNGSGCGNETASERSMMRKYIVETIVHWARDYHVDGFRFDLMGLHDLQTMQAVRDALDALDGGRGKKLIVYGEPWNGDGSCEPRESFKKRVAVTSGFIAGTGKYTLNTASNVMIKQLFDAGNLAALPERVAIFNNDLRDAARGNEHALGASGFICNTKSDDEVNKVKRGMEGGATTSFSGLYFGNASKNLAYVSAHDDYTLFDQLVGKRTGCESSVFYMNYIHALKDKMALAGGICLMSSGMTFIAGGEEFARTKFGNDNSYNSPDGVNQLVWSRSIEYAALLDCYKTYIEIRREYAKYFFSYEGYAKYNPIINAGVSPNGVFGGDNSCITFTRTANTDGKDITLFCAINAGGDRNIKLPMRGKVLAGGGELNGTVVSGSILVKGCSVVIVGTPL